MKRRVLGLAITVLWAASSQLGCAHEEHHEKERARIAVTVPLKQDTELTREFVCQIRGIQHIEVRALERGYLQGVFVDEGQTVQRGERMFQIMPIIYKAELERSAAEAEFAQIEFQNTKALQEGNVVSRNELAMAKAKLARADAERSLASAHLKLTDVRAPFEGIMGRLQVRLGSLLEEGELLTTLADNSQMWVYFNVTEAEYLNFKKTWDPSHPPTVKLRMANGEIFDQVGTVKTIEADFNNETGNIAFRATFPNPNGLLRHGETGEVLMTTVLPSALIVPQKAAFDILDRKFIYVVDDKNTVRTREITVSNELPHVYVVASGLREGERILLDDLRKVHEGDVIAPAYSDPAEVIAALDVHAE